MPHSSENDLDGLSFAPVRLQWRLQAPGHSFCTAAPPLHRLRPTDALPTPHSLHCLSPLRHRHWKLHSIVCRGVADFMRTVGSSVRLALNTASSVLRSTSQAVGALPTGSSMAAEQPSSEDDLWFPAAAGPAQELLQPTGSQQVDTLQQTEGAPGSQLAGQASWDSDAAQTLYR